MLQERILQLPKAIFTMCFVILFFKLLLLSAVSSMRSSKELEGYPAGYMSNCPGVNKPTIITNKSLKHLSFTVQGPGSAFQARRTKYSYYQMKELAKDHAINFSRPTALYVGGYLDSPNFPFAWVIGQHYKEIGYNVLHLDTNYFTTKMYPAAARSMWPTGKVAADMILRLTKEGLNPKMLHVVGLSLGGQTMSFLAKEYRRLTGTNISTLIGLDPSGPCFRNAGPEDRLDQSDADFVNVIHTNIDGFGLAAPVGHVDFYVNGGEFQPGDILWTPCDVICSHMRAYTLWLAALRNPQSFIGIKCDSVQQARNRECYDRMPLETNILGIHTDRTKPGIYYLNTNNNYPYYLGKKGLIKENDFFTSILSSYNKDNVMKL